jgi:hypothetical protein
LSSASTKQKSPDKSDKSPVSDGPLLKEGMTKASIENQVAE